MSDKQLIRLIKPFEALYNTNCPEYRDATSRKDAWNEISRMYGKPVEHCKEIWTRLRNCYTNAIKRRLRKSDKIFTPWRFEEEMSFLRPHLGSHTIVNAETDQFDNDFNDNEDNGTNDNDNNDITEYSVPSPESIIYAECKQSPLSIHLEQEDTETPIKINLKRKASTSNAHLNEIVNMVKLTQENRNILEMDDLDTFFLSISKTVKKLPKAEQVRIKINLLKTVCDAELKAESQKY